MPRLSLVTICAALVLVVVLTQAQVWGSPDSDDLSTQLDEDLLSIAGKSSAPVEGQGWIREKRHKWKRRGFYYNLGYYGSYNSYYRQPYHSNYYGGYNFYYY